MARTALTISLISLAIAVFALLGGGGLLGVGDLLSFEEVLPIDEMLVPVTPSPANIGVQPIAPTEEYVVGE